MSDSCDSSDSATFEVEQITGRRVFKGKVRIKIRMNTII